MRFWDEYSLNQNEPLAWDCKETKIAVELAKSVTIVLNRLVNNEDKVERIRINNYNSTTDKLQLVPSFPDNTILVGLKEKIIILPNKSEYLSVSLPVMVSVQYNKHVLATICADQYSKTWNGNYQHGDVQFYYESIPHPNILDKTEKLYVNVPIKVENTSNELIEINRILIKNAYLAIYEIDDYLISDTIVLKYKEHGNIYSYDIIPLKNDYASANLLNVAKETLQDKNTLTKGITNLKSFINR